MCKRGANCTPCIPLFYFVTCIIIYRTIVYSEIIRRDAIFDLFQRLRDFGIPFDILKGIGLSVLYAVPECRVCGDVDLYVGPENEERAQSVLKNFGVNV